MFSKQRCEISRIKISMSQMEELGSEYLRNWHDHLDRNPGNLTQDGFLASSLLLGFPGGSVVKKIHLPMQKMQVWSLNQEDPLEKETATYSSILAWEISQTEEPGGLQSLGSLRVRHNSWRTETNKPPVSSTPGLLGGLFHWINRSQTLQIQFSGLHFPI